MKKICSVFLIIVLVLGFNSCKNQTVQVEFYPELIRYNLYRSNSANEFSFNINVTSSQKKPKIEFISAEGVNTEYLTVSFSNDTFKSMADKRINGKYVILLGVHCRTVTEYVKIESMKLSVNNSEVEIEFSIPVENTFYEFDEVEHVLSQRNMPIYISTHSFIGYNETDYPFAVEATEDIVVKSFKFNDFLKFYGAEVLVNEETKGTLAEALPLELKKGDVMLVKTRIAFADEKYSGMENLYLNVVAECDFNGKTVTEYYPLSAIFIGNLDDAKEFVKSYAEQ